MHKFGSFVNARPAVASRTSEHAIIELRLVTNWPGRAAIYLDLDVRKQPLLAAHRRTRTLRLANKLPICSDNA